MILMRSTRAFFSTQDQSKSREISFTRSEKSAVFEEMRLTSSQLKQEKALSINKIVSFMCGPF